MWKPAVKKWKWQTKRYPRKPRKSNQTGEGNSSRLENWNTGNKENTNQGHSGNGKSG